MSFREGRVPDGRALKWEADQRLGFFGYWPRSKEQPAQPMHRKVVNIEEALRESTEMLVLWSRARRFPNVPAFSGGLLDSWPRRAVDALAICHEEEAVLSAYLAGEE